MSASVLDEVGWASLYRRLADEADGPARARAEAYEPDHFRFAVLLNSVHYTELRCELQEAGLDEDLGRAEVVAHWLRATAWTVMAHVVNLVDPPSRPSAAALADALLVDPQLSDLPLLDLAADLATLRGGLQVVARTLPPGVAGRASARCVEIDLDQAADVVETWAHELSHHLDGARNRNPEQLEEYADLLAVYLLEHRPKTVADALPWCAKAHVAVMGGPRFPLAAVAGPPPDVDLPRPGRASVEAFLALPLVVEPASAA